MSKGRRATAGLLVLVAGAVMFEVAGAWLFAQGLPWCEPSRERA